MPTSHFHLAIIGAGAAGLAAAIFAGEQARHNHGKTAIILIDGAKKPGAKILVSGGGRCNVTNADVTENDYWGGSRKIIRNVLRQFTHHDTARWMESLGVELKQEEPWGKLFPITDAARTVLDALLRRVGELGVHTRFGYRVADITRTGTGGVDSTNAPWIIRAISGETITADRVIIATGGKALPKSGSDGAGYDWLRRLGHTIVPPVPALAPLVLDPDGAAGSPLSSRFADLSGVSISAELSSGAVVQRTDPDVFTGPVLFTHFGISGPVAMNLSRHLARWRHDHSGERADVSLRIQMDNAAFGDATGPSHKDWLLSAAKVSPRATVHGLLSRGLPDRVASTLTADLHDKRLGELTRAERTHLLGLLDGSSLAVKGDRGFSFAEATAGGVALDEISWRTMESRPAENLYLCGEVLDVDGRIGGFNFQWAWSSGYVAGNAAARAMLQDE